MGASLSLLFKKERPWANPSCRSLKNRDCERITLVAFYKTVTVSKSLLSLFTKERRDLLLIHCFTLFRPKSKLLPSLFAVSLFFKEVREWFALVTLFKGVTVSKSLQKIDRKKPRICAHWIILCKKLIS